MEISVTNGPEVQVGKELFSMWPFRNTGLSQERVSELKRVELICTLPQVVNTSIPLTPGVPTARHTLWERGFSSFQPCLPPN